LILVLKTAHFHMHSAAECYEGKSFLDVFVTYDYLIRNSNFRSSEPVSSL